MSDVMVPGDIINRDRRIDLLRYSLEFADLAGISLLVDKVTQHNDESRLKPVYRGYDKFIIGRLPHKAPVVFIHPQLRIREHHEVEGLFLSRSRG